MQSALLWKAFRTVKKGVSFSDTPLLDSINISKNMIYSSNREVIELISCVICSTDFSMSLYIPADWLDRSCMLFATTANPTPASPLLAASIVAFKDRIVCFLAIPFR